MKYEQIRENLGTGDIVLFSGSGLFSRVIQIASHSPWSHVGMVLKLPEYDFLALWESTTLSKIENLTDGTATKGVQLVPLSQRIATYNGRVSIRSLQGSLPAFARKELMEFRREVKGRPYEKSHIELARAAIDIGPDQREDLSSLFCSELVAEAYQRMGLLSEDKPSNEYDPADFGGSLKLTMDLSLGDPFPVD